MYMDNFVRINNQIKNALKDNVLENKCGCCLPTRHKIKNMTLKLLEVVYPGFYSECTVEDTNAHIDNNIREVYDVMKNQVRLAFKSYNLTDEELDNKAEDITNKFFLTLPNIIKNCYTDVQEAFDGDPAATDKNLIIATYPGIFATSIQRMAHELYLLKVPYIPRIMTEYAHQKTGIDIHPGATIGEYFFIDHGTGVVIGETVEIGRHVKIYQGVTLGAISTKDGQELKGVKRHPTIKNHVTIYSDASVLGGDTVIDDYVTIGGNAFITSSVRKKEKKKIDIDTN